MNVDIKDFVAVFDDTGLEDFCDHIISCFGQEEKNGNTLDRQQEPIPPLKMEKDDRHVFVDECSPVVSEFYNIFWGSFYKEYVKQYAVLDTFARFVSCGFKVQKTVPGQGYHIWHSETCSLGTANRVLVWILYLNDVEDGGETEFLYQHRRVKPKMGRVVVWPASFTHTHRGNPPLSGSKYIATGWTVFEGV